MSPLFLKKILFIVAIIAIIFLFVGEYEKQNEKIKFVVSSPNTNIETKTTSEVTLLQATSTKVTSKPTISVGPTTTSRVGATPKQQTITIPKIRKTIPFEQINTSTRATLINILCTTKYAGPFSPVSGSGIIISSDGVILTNAHVGQYYLLKDFDGQKDFVQCVIRTGSPAYPSYLAELVYISPLWVEENLKILTEQNPKGTGEHDYAFLKIISKIDGSEVTDRLPYMPISLDENLYRGENILLASYPAGFLGGITIDRDLYQTSAITQISDVFTFGKKNTDVISVPGTVISQRGSSGGAAVNDIGQLVGIITTSSEADTTGARDLWAITMPYINRDLMANAGTNLKIILDNPQSTADTFNQTIAGTLTKILTDSILGKN